jgi:hypothetical protein
MRTRIGVADLMATYQFLVDAGKIRQAAALFAADGVFESELGEFVGPEGVLEFFSRTKDGFIAADFMPARHHLSSIRVEPRPDGTAVTYACFQFIGARGLDHWGTYRDVVVEQADGRWLFARRRATVEGYVAGSPVPGILGLELAGTTA